MTFAIQVHDWLICVVWLGINQLRTRILKDIINSENWYVIYLLRIIDIKKNIFVCLFLSMWIKYEDKRQWIRYKIIDYWCIIL